MRRVLIVRDSRGERRYDAADLPLRIGGNDAADVVMPGAAADSVLGYIALSRGHAFVQPGEGAEGLLHNQQPLSGSAWLKSGDQLGSAGGVLTWTIEGAVVLLQADTSAQPHDVSASRAGSGAAPSTEPLPVRTGSPVGDGSRPRGRRVLAATLVTLLLILAYLVVTTPVELVVDPRPERLSLDGPWPALPLAGRFLVLPGEYTVNATHPGYRPLAQPIRVELWGQQRFPMRLEELPGHLRPQLDPAVPFRLSVDGQAVELQDGVAPVARGSHRLRIDTERYLAVERQVEIEGRGEEQVLPVTLEPAWAEIGIASTPPGAVLVVDGQVRGPTPLTIELLQGARQLVFELAGYKPHDFQLQVVAGESLALPLVELEPLDGRLVLDSEPSGATVTLDGRYLGKTPLTAAVPSGREHELSLTRAGYRGESRRVTLAADEERTLDITLDEEHGTLFVTVDPAAARLTLDGRVVQPGRLSLPTRPHRLVASLPDYEPRVVTVTPRHGTSQKVDVVLRSSRQADRQALPAIIHSPAGQALQLLRPSGEFTMGASRREPGRRANESQRRVALTRPFYLGVREVTNAEFRQFRPQHDSGAADGAQLNGDDQPVVNVGWDDAARYCNWLSRQQGLPEAYREQDGHMVAVQPLNDGYRLPTEAEWAWVARVHGRDAPARYPWPGAYPPTAPAGNYADARIADTLAVIVPGYDDRYRGTAPVGSFPPWPAGFYDLGGNVAEWIHDFYAVYPGAAERLVNDPAGPGQGEHHVVRGAGWRHGSVAELRLSYRDYSRQARYDLGFRLARYAGE